MFIEILLQDQAFARGAGTGVGQQIANGGAPAAGIHLKILHLVDADQLTDTLCASRESSSC